MGDVWEPAPEGPPARGKGKGRYAELYKWMDAHPGEWAKIPYATTHLAMRMRAQGYEARTVGIVYPDEPTRCDVYVRKEA